MHAWNVVGRKMALGLAVVALVSLGWTSISSATVSITATVGNDISFPQCGSAYPSGQAFGIVGVNDGIPNTLNPCFGPSTSYPSYTQSELYWAVSTSAGAGAQAKASVYVNTADPGNVATGTLIADWPTSGSTPYGTCTTTTVTTTSGTSIAGANSPACAWEYGNTKATQDAAYLQAAAQAIDAQSPPVTVPTTPASYPWWLDVETSNTWQTGSSGQAMNVAMLQGIVAGLTAAGAPSVGIYSPPNQWVAITGGTSASTPTLGTLATWLPGASNEAGAETVCAERSFTAGPVALAQYPSGAFDGDQSCADATVTRIYGQTADTTAAAELTRAFPWTAGSCPSTRTAVVATTNVFQDALSSQFLAQHLTTGTLLTPTESLSQVTATTLEKEGITTVDVVGGPLALSTTVVKAIENLPADQCGGVNPVGNVVVHRIFGKTQYATAMAVAELVGSAGSKAFPGAYSTTNATGGTGMFNDTAGSGSSAPAGSLPTAILASGEEFQDAQAASVISYRTRLPMLLTPATQLSTTAVAAIEKLGIKQVILMGGPLAVSNAVEFSLVAKTGVSVLRIAGKDYTDTSRELARFEAAAATDGLDWTLGHRVMVARGNGYTDGLAGAVLESPHNGATGASRSPHPLLLIESPATVGPYVTTFLTVTGHAGVGGTSSKTVRALTVLGGPLAVTTASVAQMQTDLGH